MTELVASQVITTDNPAAAAAAAMAAPAVSAELADAARGLAEIGASTVMVGQVEAAAETKRELRPLDKNNPN